MHTSERHIQDRLGSALFRLTTIEQKASDATESPRAVTKLLVEVRKLTAELQRGFADLQDVIRKNAAAQQSAQTAIARADLLFELSPVACLVLEPGGVVVDANGAAARLLNVSHRHLVRKSFPLFLAADRNLFVQQIASLRDGEDALRWGATLRPRERSAVQCTVVAARDPEGRVVVMLMPGEAVEPSLDEEAGVPTAAHSGD